MPVAVVRALADEMPRLDAEERLAGMSDIAVATGSAKEGARNAHMRSLRRAAREAVHPATPADLAALGISVTHV